jgi:beta-mannanase
MRTLLAPACLFFTILTLVISSSSASAATVSFPPSADAYVSAANPLRNFGLEKSLSIDTSPITNSYLKFTVSGLTKVPASAVLKLRNVKSSSSGYLLKLVTDASWLQSTITFATAPAPGVTLASSGPTKSGTWTSFDVTNVIKANGTYSFALTGLSGSATAVSSMEGSYQPTLAVETMTSSTSSIIPANFSKRLGAYDPGSSLTSTSTITYDHYFVSWDMSTQWIPGLNQHQALLQDLSGSHSRGRQPIVTLEPWASGGMNASSLLQDIVAGHYDANVQWACSDLATYPGPVILRWGHEMENLTGRYPWATSNAGAYIAAYRHVVDKCRALAPNALYMWSPAGNRNLPSYWPGAGYVDLVGVSVYDYPAWETAYYGYNRSFHENFSERYGYVASYGKPIFIAEFGATGSTKVEWLSEALADMGNFPLLQAAVLFNAQDPAGWGPGFPAPDWRVDAALLAPPY